VEAQVGHHLVVPAAPGVHLAARRADQLGQPPLVRRVDVLVAVLDGERPGLPLAAHLLEPAADRRALLRRDRARLLKRAAVGDAAVEIGGPHDAVDDERVVEALHDRVGLAGEAAAPERHGWGAAVRDHEENELQGCARQAAPQARGSATSAVQL